MHTNSIQANTKGKALQRRHITALVAVGDCLSVHAAARLIGIPQPALSRLISETEKILGALLFERSSQGCKPTENGQLVLAQARFVLSGMNQLNDILSETRPTIRLGCIPRAMHTLVPKLLNLVYPASKSAGKNLHSEIPFELKVVEGNSTDLIENLHEGKLDFAIIRGSLGPLAGKSQIRIERLDDDKIVIICANENAELAAKEIPLKKLSLEKWVLPHTQTASRLAFDNFYLERSLEPIKPVIEVRSFEANLALVAGTLFLSIAPESIARRYSKMGIRIVQTKPALPSSPVMLAYSSRLLEHVAFKQFHNLIILAAKND